MDDTNGTPLLRMKNLEREKSIINPRLSSKMSTVINPLIRAVRRGIRMTEKFLNEQEDIGTLNLTDTDLTGRNIFHLSVQREELLEFVLDKFEKHDQLIQALHIEDVNGHTPAHLAVLHNERKSMHILAGVDKNIFTIRSKNTGKTLIHSAVESCNPRIVQEILESRPDALYDKDKNGRPLLHYAAALEGSFLLEFLLSQGADILETDKNNSTALHNAAEAGSVSNAKLLVLYDEYLLRSEDNQGRTALHIACMNGYRNVVLFLLKNGADPLVKDDGGLNCLEMAMTSKQDVVVEQLLLSDLWNELIREWQGGAKKCFAYMINKMPDNAKILLDRCIVKSNDKPDSADYHVSYDFFLLEPTDSNPPKFDGLEVIIENNVEQCLTHNLCTKYFIVKWREKGCYVYLANLFIYLCFHVLFNVYVALIRGPIAQLAKARMGCENSMQNEAFSKPTQAMTGSPEPTARPHVGRSIIWATLIVTLTLFNILKELFQMHTQRWRYFKLVSNYFEWILFAGVLIVMLPVTDTKTERQFRVAALAVFISWFNLIWFLRRIPDIGIYILTLQKVFKTLVKMLLVIVIFCMAFASTFYLLFAEHDRFKNYPISILSTFVSMLGDFSYDALFVEAGYIKDFYLFQLVVFLVFVLIMVIVVNNVLIGLAVGDTRFVMNTAKVQRLKQCMKFIIEIESSILSKLPYFKRKQNNTTHTEYPKHRKSLAENFNRLLAGELSIFYNVEESDEEGGDDVITQEKVEEIVQTSLENHQKKMMQELKDFRAEMLGKLDESRNDILAYLER